ncbi:FAD-binding domain-containing protein [Xylariaceae sp. FL0255]|nr:FAD-binding domain-containing protein [Xylariaceae sp. FL0255]
MLLSTSDSLAPSCCPSGPPAVPGREGCSLSETCWLPATCFVRPSTPQDVGQVLKAVEQHGSKFAIRCGGHNPNPPFSSIDDSGILIDVSELKTLSLCPDGVLQMGAGNRWGEVYAYLEEHGRMPIGGRQNGIGLATDRSAGGMPAFPAFHGFAPDQVQNFEVALADATIINANEKENSELWEALKGGGPKFAQYTVNTYNPSDYVNIMNATAKLQEAMEMDPKLGAFVYVNLTYIAAGLLYAEWGSKFSADFYIKVHKIYQEIVQNLQPAPTAAIKFGELRGGNIMGLEEWDSPANDMLAQQAIDELYQGMQKMSREEDQWLDFIFMNEGKWTQDVLASYGEANLQEIKKIQSKYDPKGVFQNLQNDEYLLRKVA